MTRRRSRAKRATPSCWHATRLFGKGYGYHGSRTYARVQRECEHGAPFYLAGTRWARWADNAQGV